VGVSDPIGGARMDRLEAALAQLAAQLGVAPGGTELAEIVREQTAGLETRPYSAPEQRKAGQ